MLYRKALITIITITLIGGSVLPGLVPSTYAASDGRKVTFTYEGELVKTMTDPLERVTHYDYDTDKNLIKVTYADDTFVSYSYDDEHHLISVTLDECGKGIMMNKEI